MRVALMCEDALTRDGLRCLLAATPEFRLVAAGENWPQMENAARRRQFDLLLIVGGISQKEAASISRAQVNGTFQVISDIPHRDLKVHALFQRKEGFAEIERILSSLPASPSVQENRALYGGGFALTPREREVARLVSQGMPNRRIATVLGIQEQSVKNLVSVVMRKLRCENRVQLALHLSSATQ